MAETAVSMLPWPEIITTGRSGWRLLISSSSARPSSLLPCIQISRKTRRGTRSLMAASALSLSKAVRVSCPSSERMPETISRMSSSSSTTRISDAMAYFLALIIRIGGHRFLVGQDHTDHRPLAVVEDRRRIVQLELPAMVFDDLLDDCEAEPRALLAHRHIGFENAVPVLGRKALAV